MQPGPRDWFCPVLSLPKQVGAWQPPAAAMAAAAGGGLAAAAAADDAEEEELGSWGEAGEEGAAASALGVGALRTLGRLTGARARA
jgi:hypothetical protein